MFLLWITITIYILIKLKKIVNSNEELNRISWLENVQLLKNDSQTPSVKMEIALCMCKKRIYAHCMAARVHVRQPLRMNAR